MYIVTYRNLIGRSDWVHWRKYRTLRRARLQAKEHKKMGLRHVKIWRFVK